jgi:hypothetical protein
MALRDDASGLFLGLSRAVRLPFEISVVRQLLVLFAEVLVRVNDQPPLRCGQARLIRRCELIVR